MGNKIAMSLCNGFRWAKENSPNEAMVNMTGTRFTASKANPALISGVTAKGTKVEFVTTSSGNVQFNNLPSNVQEAITKNLDVMEKGAQIVLENVTITKAETLYGDVVAL